MPSQAAEGSDLISVRHVAHHMTDCNTVGHASLSCQQLMTNALQTQ